MYFCILLSTTSVSKNSGWGMLFICIFAIELLGEREEGVGKTSLPPPPLRFVFSARCLCFPRECLKKLVFRRKRQISFFYAVTGCTNVSETPPMPGMGS
jgi:hypothetical protein